MVKGRNGSRCTTLHFKLQLLNCEVAFAIYPESLSSFLRLSLCNFEDFRGEEILNMSKFDKRKERGRRGEEWCG